MYRLILVSICICGLIYGAQGQKKIKCNSATEKEMDEVVSKIMTYGTSRPYPTNKTELKEYCKEDLRLVNKLENYKNTCLKNQAKSVVSVIAYSIKQVINLYCKHPNAKRTTELLESAICANAATNDYNKCNVEYIQRLQYAIVALKQNQSKERLIQSCCGYGQIFKCVREQAANHEVCTPDRIDANINFIRAFFDNAINAACGEYNESSDKCDRVEIPPPKKTKKALPKSFFNPLVELLSGL